MLRPRVHRPLGSVADDEIGEALELLWGTAAVNAWNARRAAVLSWLGWCESYGYDGPAVPAWTKRLAVPDSETPARSKMAMDRLIARREVHLREKTLWRMLYETAGRSEEILGVNIEDLDLAARRCPVKARGARSKARRRGQAREDFVLEPVYWDAGTAWLRGVEGTASVGFRPSGALRDAGDRQRAAVPEPDWLRGSVRVLGVRAGRPRERWRASRELPASAGS